MDLRRLRIYILRFWASSGPVNRQTHATPKILPTAKRTAVSVDLHVSTVGILAKPAFGNYTIGAAIDEEHVIVGRMFERNV